MDSKQGEDVDIDSLTFYELNVDIDNHDIGYQLMEEVGEYVRICNKGYYKGNFGIEELLDIAQTAVHGAIRVAKKYNLNLDTHMQLHMDKMKTRGYLKEDAKENGSKTGG